MPGQNAIKIEILVGHCLGGADNDAYPGDIIEAPGKISVEDALAKVRMGFARLVAEAPEASNSPASGAAQVVHGDPEAEVRDPETKPARGGRGKSRSSTGGR